MGLLTARTGWAAALGALLGWSAAGCSSVSTRDGTGGGASSTTSSGPSTGGTSSTSGSGGAGGIVPVVVSDFELMDVNATSATFGTSVSPRDFLEQVSGWFFGSAT